MTPADRIHIYVGEPLRRLLDESGDDASRVVNALAAAHLALCDGAMPLREAAARLTYALATCTDARAADVATILREGAGLLELPEGATLSSPAGLVLERREAWCSLIDALRLDAVGAEGEWDDAAVWTPTRAGQWESVLATLLIARDWTTIEQTARDLRGEVTPETGESTEPLTDDQVATLVELARSDRREDYDALCAALGVVNGPALWEGIRRRLTREG